jgi:hypothetical protein
MQETLATISLASKLLWDFLPKTITCRLSTPLSMDVRSTIVVDISCSTFLIALFIQAGALTASARPLPLVLSVIRGCLGASCVARLAWIVWPSGSSSSNVWYKTYIHTTRMV